MNAFEELAAKARVVLKGTKYRSGAITVAYYQNPSKKSVWGYAHGQRPATRYEIRLCNGGSFIGETPEGALAELEERTKGWKDSDFHKAR